MENLFAFGEKVDIWRAEDFSSAFVLREVGLQVFAGSHGEEKCARRELGDGDVLGGGFSGCELSENTGWEGFLLFCVPIRVPVSAELLLEEDGYFFGWVQSGVGPVVRPEGLCHMIHGGADRDFNQGCIRSPREASFPDGLGKCGHEEVLGP